jgi:predicted nucleic acid-binding protein
MRPHIVLDTNVLIAGLRSRRGASFALLGLLIEEAFVISVSVPLVLEYEAVARRQARELGLTFADVNTVVEFLRDPSDDMVLEVAVEAQCAYIVTFNTRDFAGVERFGLRTLTPGEFLVLLQEDV